MKKESLFKRIDFKIKEKLGFSLVELMISLIVISVVTAAFAPVVTKKLKTSDQSIGNASNDYVYDANICSDKGLTNCSVCVANECVKCNSGYYLDDSDGSCKACSEGCTTCTNSTTCTKCATGYYLDSNTCKICSPLCSSCYGPSFAQCSTCKAGRYLDSSGHTCAPCPDGCSECQLVDGNAYCFRCQSGYYQDGSGKCLQCPTGCTMCSNGTTCTKCDGGYRLNGSTCSAISCPAGCVSCNYTTGVCNTCATGYYKNGNNCSACASNCLKCTASNNCQMCASGTYWNGSGCVACGANCQVCQTSGCKRCINNTVPSGGGCTACTAGYYSDGVQCKLCHAAGKFTCTSPLVITGCTGGRYWGGTYYTYLRDTCCDTKSYLDRCALWQLGNTSYGGFDPCGGCTHMGKYD